MAVKPTVSQYNISYGGLRQNSQPDFDIVREWILNLSPGGGVTPINYSALLILIGSSSLVPGTLYCIDDFRTRQEIPNTAVIHLGAVENICVFALSESVLSWSAYSVDFPNDLLVYDINNVDFGADMGRILYREDTNRNNLAHFNWREYQQRR